MVSPVAYFAHAKVISRLKCFRRNFKAGSESSVTEQAHHELRKKVVRTIALVCLCRISLTNIFEESEYV